MFFSKSKYCTFWQCPKMSWLDKYKPDEKETDASAESRFKTGHEVGELAKRLFGDFIEVSVFKEDGSLDKGAMIEQTKREMINGTETICEAAFSYDGLYCAVDLLHKEGDGYAIYEVKSSTTKDKPKEEEKANRLYCVDIAYQKYVLEKCGVKVTGTYLVKLNKRYVKCGDIDIKNLFVISDASDYIKEEYNQIEDTMLAAERVLSSAVEPTVDISPKCKGDYECGYWKYCTKFLPENSVFSLYDCRKRFQFYQKGIVSFDDLLKSGEKINEVQLRQIEFTQKDDKEVYVDKLGLKGFLDTLTYPLYFLDFETTQSGIPIYDGTSPYQKIPFQYSLHYIESAGAPLQHKEFLAESGKNPLRAIAESLCESIPKGVCSLVYNKSFEQKRLQELAGMFPDLEDHLTSIADGLIDLLVPFQKGYYYKKQMGGSFSVKVVLPAMFPDDDSLNYQNLEGVHNGSDAMDIFPKLQDMPQEEALKWRERLLRYCCLDTLAMVKIWEELVRVAQ